MSNKQEPQWVDKSSKEYRTKKVAEFFQKVDEFKRVNEGASEGQVYDYAVMLHAIHFRGILNAKISERFRPID
jgi:hypothetical protein